MPPHPLRVEASAVARANPGMDPLGGGYCPCSAGAGRSSRQEARGVQGFPENSSKSSGTSGVVGVKCNVRAEGEPADVAIAREDCLLPPVPGKISRVPGHPEIARDRARERPPTFSSPGWQQGPRRPADWGQAGQNPRLRGLGCSTGKGGGAGGSRRSAGRGPCRLFALYPPVLPTRPHITPHLSAMRHPYGGEPQRPPLSPSAAGVEARGELRGALIPHWRRVDLHTFL